MLQSTLVQTCYSRYCCKHATVDIAADMLQSTLLQMTFFFLSRLHCRRHSRRQSKNKLGVSSRLMSGKDVSQGQGSMTH
ncbi:hypothetical protein BgiBS90_006775, partial [Biomphalaria glabrata]